MAQIKLHTLHCILNDETDKDEIYLTLDGKKIWPGGLYKQINSGEKIDLKVSFKHDEEEIQLQLWDFDYLSKNDHLGTFIIVPHGDRGRFTANMRQERPESTASYILEWEATD